MAEASEFATHFEDVTNALEALDETRRAIVEMHTLGDTMQPEPGQTTFTYNRDLPTKRVTAHFTMDHDPMVGIIDKKLNRLEVRLSRQMDRFKQLVDDLHSQRFSV